MKKDTLQAIYEALAHVADLQFALDAGKGDQITHWQELGMIDQRLRRLVQTLPDEVIASTPSLAKYAMSSTPLYSLWSECRDEVGMALAYSF